MGLLLPERKIIRALGIDPGNSKFGVAIVDMEWESGTKNIVTAETFIADQLVEEGDYLSHHRSDRFVRQYKLMRRLLEYLELHAPDTVGIEGAFSHIRPEAYGALVEISLLTNITLAKYNLNIPIFKIAPREAKAAIKAKSHKDKEAIPNAILASDIGNKEIVKTLDEHANDAIAIAFTLLCKYQENLC